MASGLVRACRAKLERPLDVLDAILVNSSPEKVARPSPSPPSSSVRECIAGSHCRCHPAFLVRLAMFALRALSASASASVSEHAPARYRLHPRSARAEPPRRQYGSGSTPVLRGGHDGRDALDSGGPVQEDHHERFVERSDAAPWTGSMRLTVCSEVAA